MAEAPAAENFLGQRHAGKLCEITSVEIGAQSARLKMKIEGEQTQVVRDLSYKNPSYVFLRNIFGADTDTWLHKPLVWVQDGKWMKVTSI